MSHLINTILQCEERLIFLNVQKKFISHEIKQSSFEEVKLINNHLSLTCNSNIAFQVHMSIVNSLITYYMLSTYTNNLKNLELIFNFEQIEDVNNLVQNDIKLIPELIEELHIVFINSHFSVRNGLLKRKKSKHHLKQTGSVYTLKSISSEIAKKTINEAYQGKDITCLDFACGTGRFYFEALNILSKDYSLDLKHIICNNLFAIDLDEVAIQVLRCKVISLFTENEIDLDVFEAITKNIINRNALIQDNSLIPIFENCLDTSTDFKKPFLKGGFDVVFSNPPYYLLKANRNKTGGFAEHFHNLKTKLKNELNYFKNSDIYIHSIEGMLNYYQLSIELIIKMTKESGQIGIICPSSLFADLTSSKLRKYILNLNKLNFIRYYPENSKLFENVAQSTVVFNLQKGSKTEIINIECNNESYKIDLNTILSIFPKNQEIPLMDEMGWRIINKISKYNKIKKIAYLRNKRGELDLTLFKEYITKTNTGCRLIRGNMISEEGIIDKNNEFVEIALFVSKKSKDYKQHDYRQKRLVCQQISNIDTKKRLKFTFSKTTDVIANSCNYITSLRDYSDLKKMHYILNSELLNWRFKVTSSNNHINNYEIDELPIIDLDKIDLKIFTNDNYANNQLICKMYGLSDEESSYILKNINILHKVSSGINEAL